MGRDESGTVLHAEASDFFDTWGIADPIEQQLWRFFWHEMTSEMAAAAEERLAPDKSEE